MTGRRGTPYPGTSALSGESPCPGLSHSRPALITDHREADSIGPRTSGLLSSDSNVKESAVYAIVRAGGRQEKVAVGDVVQIDKVDGEPGSTITLPALLVVDGETVTSDAKTLSGVTVSAEVVGATKGPKITIMKFKNKTGYRKRQGHRQKYTQVKITDIAAGK